MAQIYPIDLTRHPSPFHGGWNPLQPSNDEIQRMCNAVRNEVQSYERRIFQVFRAVQYRTQVLSWTTHFIKVYVGGNEFVHVKVHKDIEKNVHLICYVSEKTGSAPIMYF
ncbi:cystatin-A-like [Pelobates fuscus]|uniref:cystatin-A-like n=1 Tax=Pelobates fuscus TaxID=191477 RepID=UPI002FE48F04